MKALGFGAIEWDDIPDKTDGPCHGVRTPEARNIGGAVFNVMAHLARLGCQSAMVSAIGTDALGKRTLDAVTRTGVRTDLLLHVDRPTCLVPVVFNEAGQPSYHVPEDVSWDYIDVDDSMVAATQEEAYDTFCFGTIEQRSETSRHGVRRLLEQGRFGSVLLDVNLRTPFYSKEVVEYSLAHCSVVKMNREEAMEIKGMFGLGQTATEPFLAAVRDGFGIDRIVMTDAAAGAYHLDNSAYGFCPGYEITVADPVGAGDAFAAGLMWRLCAGDSLAEACDFGNRLGALIASRTSSIPDYDLAELDCLHVAARHESPCLNGA